MYSLVTKQHRLMYSYNIYTNNIVSCIVTLLTQQRSSAMYPAMSHVSLHYLPNNVAVPCILP
jgi:fucose permease